MTIRSLILLLAAAPLLLTSASGCDYLRCDQTDEEGRCAVVLSVPGGGIDAKEFANATRLDHLGLAAVMRSYAKSDSVATRVDYAGIAASPEAQFQLTQYLAGMAEVDPSKLESPEQRFAFWVNTYNAHVVQGVLDNWDGKPSYKVTDTSDFFDKLLVVAGQQMSLNQIENVIVRGDVSTYAPADATQRALFAKWHTELWNGKTPDARLHAAFNCGALSCPDLLAGDPFVFRAETLEAQLEANTKAWLDAAKGASAAGISKLFDWYKQDFVAEEGSVEAFIAKHRTGGATGINLTNYLEYDWTLNIVQ
jgi:hypothetical protein